MSHSNSSRDRRRSLQLLLRTLRKLVGDRGQHTELEWALGQLPPRGEWIVFADGFGSRSTRDPTSLAYEPWLEYVRSDDCELAESHKDRCRGFSYYRVGKHYFRYQTNVAFRFSSRLTGPYVPRVDSPGVYVAFSLAGTLFPLGLGDTEASGSESSLKSLRSLVLLQPALELHDDIIDAAIGFQKPEDGGSMILRPIYELADVDLRIRMRDAVISGLANLSQQGISTVMYYWPSDEFVKYDPELVDQLVEAGVDCRPLQLDFSPGTNPFRMHSEVATHPVTIREISTYLDSVFAVTGS